ncbi:MAG: MATE family efflux transporter [Oscillospiraceae bacterium]|nr:MATE family efflux transporter [Oscillospiraceae bacterium]
MKNHLVLREFFKYTSLNILGMAGISCYILADTFFVAKGLGNNGLTALNLAIPLYSFMYGIGIMLGTGGGAMYSILRSQGKEKESNSVFSLTVLIGAIVSVFLMISGIFFHNKLAILVGADSQVMDMTSTYLMVLWTAAPLFIFNNIIIMFTHNDNAPHIAMIGMITGSLMNVLLDYIFIFPLNMGMFGAVLATAMSPGISLLFMSVHFIRRKNNFHLNFSLPIFRYTKKVLSLGFTSFVNEVSSGIIIMVFNLILISISGNTAVAAYGIIANVSIVIIAVFTGIAQGTQPLVSKYYGLENQKNIRKLFRYGFIYVTLLSAVIYSLMFIFSDGITSIFNSENNMELNQIAVYGIHIYFTGIAFAGLNILFSVLLSAQDKAKYATIISVARGIAVILPVTLILSYFFGITGLWLSFPVSEGIVLVISIISLILTNKNQSTNI